MSQPAAPGGEPREIHKRALLEMLAEIAALGIRPYFASQLRAYIAEIEFERDAARSELAAAQKKLDAIRAALQERPAIMAVGAIDAVLKGE